jgi:DNA-binding NtrC family response regulator
VNCNILLVDDDEIILETYKTILEMDGYTVYDASSPYKAIQIIKKIDIQLAILDYNLPQMTGTQLGHLISKTQEATRIMFISGNSAIHELVKEVDYQVYDVLSKPIEIDQLIKTVKNIVGETCIPYQVTKPTQKIKIGRISRMIERISENVPNNISKNRNIVFFSI